MPGSSNITGDESIIFCDNMSFDGTERGGKMTTNGQLWIGSSVAPHVRLATLTAGAGTTITNGNGTITISASSTSDVQTLTGNSGGAISPTGGTINVVTANSTVKFVGSGSTLTEDFGISNLILGSSSPSITSASSNISVGNGSLVALTSGSTNVVLGSSSAVLLSSAVNNTIVGGGAANSLTTSDSNVIIGAGAGNAITTGTGLNTLIGTTSGSSITTGSRNICIGNSSGISYTSTESSNIIIGNGGTVGESNKIHIGTSGSGVGQQNACFVAGITGVTVAASAPTAVDSNGQLSSLGFGTTTQVLTSNGAGVSPTWQAVPFVASPTYFQAYRTTNQTVAGGDTTTTIVFDTAISNVGSAYNTSTGIFTAPVTGFYAFSTTVFFSDLTTPVGLSQIILGYTGSVQSLRVEQFGLVPATTGSALICTASWYMPMTSGDTVKIQTFADGTGNYTIAGGALANGAFNTSSTFSGFRVA